MSHPGRSLRILSHDDLNAKDQIRIAWNYLKDDKWHSIERRHWSNVHSALAIAVALDRIADALEGLDDVSE